MLFNQFKNVSNGKYNITWGSLVVSFVCELLIVTDDYFRGGIDHLGEKE